MYKKVIMLMFVGVVSVGSVVASAAGNESKSNVNNTSVIDNMTSRGDNQLQIARVEAVDVQTSATQIRNNGETTLPESGWLLFAGLVGFVMLSNRMRV